MIQKHTCTVLVVVGLKMSRNKAYKPEGKQKR